ARAARASFPEVRFQSPVTVPAGSERTAEVRHGSWTRWLIAASVLLALGGIGYVGDRQNALHRQIVAADEKIALAGGQQSELIQDRARAEAKARESLQSAQAEWQALTARKYQELVRVNETLAN